MYSPLQRITVLSAYIVQKVDSTYYMLHIICLYSDSKFSSGELGEVMKKVLKIRLPRSKYKNIGFEKRRTFC